MDRSCTRPTDLSNFTPFDDTVKLAYIDTSIAVASINNNEITIGAIAKGTTALKVKVNGQEYTVGNINCIVTEYVNGIEVSPSTESFTYKDETKQLTATLDSNAPDKYSVSWSSSNTKVATVDDDGVVTAVASGTATITAKVDGTSYEDTCNVTVTIDYVKGVTVTPKTESLTYVGETKNLSATLDSNNPSKYSVSWISSDTSVATVDDGVVTAVASGTATITASVDGTSYADTCSVTVTIDDVSEIDITESNESITWVGETLQLSKTLTASDPSKYSVTWSSSNTAVATVSNTGLVTAVSAGTTTITAKVTGTSYEDTCTVSIPAWVPVTTGGGTVDFRTDSNGNLTYCKLSLPVARQNSSAILYCNKRYNVDKNIVYNFSWTRTGSWYLCTRMYDNGNIIGGSLDLLAASGNSNRTGTLTAGHQFAIGIGRGGGPFTCDTSLELTVTSLTAGGSAM